MDSIISFPTPEPELKVARPPAEKWAATLAEERLRLQEDQDSLREREGNLREYESRLRMLQAEIEAGRMIAAANTPIVTQRSTPLDLLEACDRPPLSTAEVSAGMRTVSGAIQECYEHQNATQPDLRGSLTVRLTVLPDGSFSDVQITENTLGAPAVDTCIVEIVSRVRIAHGSAAGPATFTFPYSCVPRPSL